MKTVRFLISVLVLTLSALVLTEAQSGPSYPPLLFQDEGVAQGRATRAVNCTGAGVTCSASAGVITIDASGGGGGAPTDATYITQTANGTLSAEQALSGLTTGIVKVTNGTGVLSTAVAGDFPTLNQNTTGTAAGLSATLAVGSGGTNLTASADDNVMVGNGTTWETKAVPDCDAASTSKLLYDVTTNTFSCGTDQGAGSGAALTRINGSSGAAGTDFTFQKLSANCTANATTTLATCMTTTGVGAGTWRFTYAVIYQAAATSTGVDFAINHTGTVTKMVASSWFNSTGGTAATGLADQVQSNTANMTEGKSARALNTKFGSSLGVDTINADMLMIIEGTIVVTASGDLELRHASEVAASSQVMAESTLELRKIG